MDDITRELQLRETIIEQLKNKKEIAVKSGAGATQIGKLEIAIKEVENGDLTSSTVVKQLVKDANDAVKKEAKTKSKSESQLELEKIIKDYNFHVSSTGSSVWYYQPLLPDEFGNRSWVSIKKDNLLVNFRPIDVYIKMGPGLEDYSSFKEFNRLLVEQGRTFTSLVQTYKETEQNTLNIINKRFCPAAADGSSDYHWIFDAVIESISGGAVGDKESFEPFQQTIWCKYIHPDSPFLPNLFIKDLGGRAGKGLISNTFLRRLFMGNVADNCNTDHVTGKFNSVIAGKAIIVVNETKRDKVDVERMKAFLGSPRFMVEEKFLTPYLADNTGLLMSYSNESTGGITLSGTDSDNRYSMFSTKNNIYETCQRYFQERDGVKVTIQQVKEWIESTDENSGQNLLFSEHQVGKWINAMHKKHGDVTTVKPVHGEEYRRMLDRQRGGWTQTVEQVFADPEFTYIRADLLDRLVRHMNVGEIIPGKNRMREEIQRLIKDRGFKVIIQDRAKIWTNRITKTFIQRTVWRVDTGLGVQTELHDNDDRYGTEEHGRWTWTWK